MPANSLNPKPKFDGYAKGKRQYPALTQFKPVLKEIYSDAIELRRLDYLNTICEMSGSTEGNELESLSNLTRDEFHNYSFTDDVGDFENLELIKHEN